MIINLLYFILNTVLGIVNAIPKVEILPFGIDAVVMNAVYLFKLFIVIVPPANSVFNIFLIYIGFKFSLFVLKLIFGHRAPSHSIT